jgi:type IV pilus assembly protein PilV
MKQQSEQLGTRFGSPLIACAQSGFSMIEVLVTLVVLSTGLLGVADLQVAALRGNQGAYLASLAAQQAQDMAERMKTNPAGVAANQYDNLDASIPGVPVNCQSANCTPAQLAVFDHNRWNASNQALLPSGAGVVSEISNSIFLIGVRWHDKQLAGANGWQAGTEAETACGAPQADTRCFTLRYQA